MACWSDLISDAVGEGSGCERLAAVRTCGPVHCGADSWACASACAADYVSLLEVAIIGSDRTSQPASRMMRRTPWLFVVNGLPLTSNVCAQAFRCSAACFLTFRVRVTVHTTCAH